MPSVFSQKKFLNSLLLYILNKQGPSHGYALTQFLEEQFNWKTSQTNIYNVLKHLESNKFVTSEEQIKNGRIQKNYSISKPGVEFLAQTKHVRMEEIRKNVSKLLVLLYHYGENELSPQEQMVEQLITNMKQINEFSLSLMEHAPTETQEILTTTIRSLESLAAQKNITID